MACKQLLAAALGEETVVEKVRELWWYKNVRIHVDDVARLGSFIEFEGIVDAAHDSELSRTRIEWLTRQLEIGEHDWIDRSYRELIMDKAKASS
jgi:predicted adenylyl cyclase CyaB